MPTFDHSYTLIAVARNNAGLASLTLNVLNSTVPILAEVSDQSYEAGRTITPLNLINRGGDLQASDACVVEPALPTGLMIAKTLDDRTCRISGKPADVTTGRTYAITAKNARGSSQIDIDIEVHTSPRPPYHTILL